MNKVSHAFPGVEFILRLWLKNEVNWQDDAYNRAEELGLLSFSNIGWKVNREWFLEKISSDTEIFSIDSPEKFAFLILGLGELMARTSDYRMERVVTYVRSAPAAKSFADCLPIIISKVKEYFPPSLDLPLETLGELQVVNNVKITPDNVILVDRLFGRGPHSLFRCPNYGLSCGLKILLRIDGRAVGEWLQTQEHPLVLDAALYALKYAFLMFLSPDGDEEIVQLIRSNHALVCLTGFAVVHTPSLDRGYPLWTTPLAKAFQLTESAGVPIGTSIWTSLFRIKELSLAYERCKRNYKEAEEHFAYASEDSNYFYGKKAHHSESMDQITIQNNLLKNAADEIVQIIISHWPQSGLLEEDLRYCSEIISPKEIWLQFLDKVPVSKDRKYLITHTLKKFTISSNLFNHDEYGHCYATEQMFEDACIVAKIFSLLDHDNLGKNFGKLFFSDKNESLRLDDQILSEPYSYRKRFTAYNHALNALGIANYIAIQIGTDGLLRNKKGATFLLEQGALGLAKVIAAAQGNWDIAEDALQKFLFALLESLSLHEEIISDDVLESFLGLPQLKYSFRAMLGFSRQALFKKHSEYIFLLLEQSLLPTVIWQHHFKNVTSSFFAFDFALMRLAKINDTISVHRVTTLWQNGLANHIDPIPAIFVDAIEKIEKALFGDKQCFDWLVNSPSLSNTWSANYLRTNHKS